jgi:histidyl-tRNA synthetase
VGISIGLTRLFFVLEDQGYLNDALNTAPADVLILPMTQDLAPAIALATRLRQAGIRTQIHAEQKKFKQKMTYADKIGVPYVVFLGEDEIASGLPAVKNMSTGEQVKLTPDEAVAQIKAGLEALEQGKPILDKGEN